MENIKIKSFKDLNTWKEAHKLVLLIYKISKVFPDEEKFGLTNQIRRASVSISSNIAEGFGRNTKKDKINFYTMAKASLNEVECQSLIAKDLGFLDEGNFKIIEESLVVLSKLLSGVIKSAVSINTTYDIQNT